MRKCEGKSRQGKKPIVRQAAFREDGSLTDMPARDSEKPQLEKQADLLQFGKDKANLERLIDS